MPIPAIVLVCVGGALILAGVAYLVITIVRLVRAARKVGIDSLTDVQVFMRKVQNLEPRFRELEKNQLVLTENLRKLTTETAKLNYLKDELDEATWHITKIKK